MLFRHYKTFIRFVIVVSALFIVCSVFGILSEKSSLARDLPITEPTDTAPPLTVVIDAGHGGEDGGASSASGVLEKELNLQIAERLCDLLKSNGVNVVMTRTEDTMLYDKTVDYKGRKKALDLAARQRITEEAGDCIFVSIHMNAYPQPQYRGLQVWYSPNNPDSQSLATLIQQTVAKNLQPENTRQIKRATSAIYLLHHLQMPAVLVECGFLSNAAEAELLASERYQKDLAYNLYLAIMEYQAAK